jgi:hypothetical protein
MAFKRLALTLLSICLMLGGASAADLERVDPGPWSETELTRIITAAGRLEAPGDRVVALSRHFLDTPYVADTLIGGPQTAEQLVINLAGFDCFTLLDVVEALRRAVDGADFPEQLQQVRYRDGRVTYANRRHFFSDWVAGAAALIGDVTAAVGSGRAQLVVKQLNLKSDGTPWLPGIPVVRREIVYIPTSYIDRQVLAALEAGDYLGIYSEQAGLDVAHVGLVVKGKDGVLLRHASSANRLRRVVDVDLLEYLQGKAGLIVYRVEGKKGLD